MTDQPQPGQPEPNEPAPAPHEQPQQSGSGSYPQQPAPYPQQPQQSASGSYPQQPAPYPQQPQQGGYPAQAPPPSGGMYGPGPAGGQPPLRPEEEGTWAALATFGAFILGFLAPLIVYLVQKDRSPYVREVSRQALNFNLSWMIWTLISILTLVGWIVVLPAYYVFMILGGVKAMNREPYKYPLTIEFVK